MLNIRSLLLAAATAVAALCLLPPSNHVDSAIYQGCLPGSLKSTLYKIRKRYGPPRVISAHRPGARIRGTGKRSYHASCRAVDFHPPRGQYRAVLSWLKANHSGGVGTYSGKFHHIHIDNGPRTRWHKRY
ncbi:MAG: YcbK family protein [Hyphomicrobiaceae bacterium]